MPLDLFRFPWVKSVRWVGAAELLGGLVGHDRIEIQGEAISNPAGLDVVIRDRKGRRLAIA